MPLFGRKSKTDISQRSEVPIDNTLPDAEWLSESHSRFDRSVDGYYGSPETMAEGGKVNYGVANFGVALFFFQKSIDMLHTQYLFFEMRNRQPSPADAWIVDGYVNSLGAALSLHPTAPIAGSVREVTHRLRTISTACQRVGVPNQLYMGALSTLASDAPQVDVSDILW